MGVIIGTAGHVDHGKTELIKALTGVDTDRLEEEKRRGLTIDLGFAPLDLPKSGRVGIIDVPGHIDFLKNMLAGVGGIDLAILVLAADEGVMPQTVEHLRILELLRIPKLIIAVSKVDLADSETRELVAEEVKGLLKGSYLENSPLVQVSPVSREGLGELVEIIDQKVGEFPEKDFNALPRLLVDRVFGLKGVGTVVTGSLLSGRIEEGDELVIYPKLRQTRARQIQVFYEKRGMAEAGSRVALNLPGVGKGEIGRGDVISKKETLLPTKLLDVKLELLPSAKRIKDWARVRLYLGSGEFLGRMALFGKKELKPGEEGFCQLRLEEEVVALYGDRFIIRRYSPMDLLGGGVVLNPSPSRHKRSDPGVLKLMEARARGDLEEMIVAELKSRELEEKELWRSLSARREDWERTLEDLVHRGEIVSIRGCLFGRSRWEELRGRVVKELQDFHSRYPLRPGMPKEELKSRFPLHVRLFDDVLGSIEEIGVVGGKVRLKSLETKLTREQLSQKRKLEEVFLRARFSPPEKGEVIRDFDEEIFHFLIEEGALIKVSAQLFFHKEAIEEAKRLVSEFLKENGEMRLSDMRDILGSTRKYMVPLAEYFDRVKLTRRSGDLRTLGRV